MNKKQGIALVILRVTLGWMFLYSGITKVLDPTWTSKGYLLGAKTFAEMYAWFASPAVLPLIDFINQWGQLLIGAALILGIFVRLASTGGIALMALYYLPILDFPYPNTHSYIVDEHIIYIAAFLILAVFRAGRMYGLENWCASLPICRKFPRLRGLLG